MNLMPLLSLSGGIAFQRRNPFKRVEANPLPYLESVKAPDTQGGGPALESVVEAGRSREPARAHERLGLAVLTLMVAVSAATAGLCAQGAYHVSRVRQVATLSNQLRQKELELQSMTQTCHFLQSEVTRQTADESWAGEVHLVSTKRPSARATRRLSHILKPQPKHPARL
jgi:hypothetical protein